MNRSNTCFNCITAFDLKTEKNNLGFITRFFDFVPTCFWGMVEYKPSRLSIKENLFQVKIKGVDRRCYAQVSIAISWLNLEQKVARLIEDRYRIDSVNKYIIYCRISIIKRYANGVFSHLIFCYLISIRNKSRYTNYMYIYF